MALGVNEAQENKMIMERAARNKQNTKNPYLINIKDGRLVPNVPALAGRPSRTLPTGQVELAKAGHKDYRIYTGDPKASKEERLRWVQSYTGNAMGPAGRPISLSNVEPFDVGTATMDELIDYAQSEFGIPLSKQLGLKAVRNEVIKLAKEAGLIADEDKLN